MKCLINSYFTSLLLKKLELFLYFYYFQNRNLPLSVKKIVYYAPEEEEYENRSKGKWREG